MLQELDHESQPVITFNITVTDPGGLTDTTGITINVTNVEEDPTFFPIVVDVSENLAAGTEIADARHEDYLDDPDDLVEAYTEYAGNTNPNFSISTLGVITLNNPLDFESYAGVPREFFYIEARDSQGNVMELITVQVNVTDANEPPEITSTVTDITVAEGPFDNTLVLENITATDPDAGDASQLTYDFVGFLNDTYFTIDSNGDIRQKSRIEP